MYRESEQPYVKFLQSPSGQRYFQEVSREEFQFLWYVYNRGGILNNRTVSLYFGCVARVSRRRLSRLQNRECITPLFHKTTYKKTDGQGTRSYLFRVSNKFLTAVSNKDSNIRKTNNINKAIVPLAVCNYFLMPSNRHFVLINRRARNAFLKDRFGLQEADFPRYFLGSRKKFVISLNHEIATHNDQVFIIWYPQSLFGTEFSRFAKRWARVFAKAQPHIKCLVITHNNHTQNFFKHIVPSVSVSKEEETFEKIRQVMSPTRRQKKHLYSFAIQTAHYPDVWDEYSQNQRNSSP